MTFNALWDRLDPGFLEPIWLVVGVFAMIAVVLLEIGSRRYRKRALQLFIAPHLARELTASISPVRRLIKSALIVAATGLLFVALARPHLFFELREESRSGFDLLFAVDCSRSMLSEDVKPNRLERAKLAIADFADHLQENRLGLIAFAGDAFLQCPLTIDHDAFQTAVRELDTDTIPRSGTDVATAIEQAVLALKSQPNNLKFLILVTDGEDLEGRAIDAAREAAKSGLKIYTVGVGTSNGDLIPLRDDSGAVAYLHDSSGQIVQTKLDESTLRQIASITGGAYVPLGQRGEGLEEIYQRYIAPLPHQHFEEKREKIRYEHFEWPLGLALILLALEFLITERIKSKPVAAVTTPLSTVRRRVRKPAQAAVAPLLALGLLLPLTTRAATIDHAQNDYKKGDYKDALQNYQAAAEKEPDRQDLQYNLGSAAYKAGEFNEAEAAFRKALDTSDLGLQENSYYNLGNAQFKHGESMQQSDKNHTMELWQQALKSYDAALKLNRTADAQHNYEIVKKLEELKQQQKQQQQQQQQQNQQDSKQDKNDSNNSQQQKQDNQGKPGQPSDKDQQQQQGNQNKDQNAQPQQGGDKQNQQQQQSQSGKEGDKDGQKPDQGNGPKKKPETSQSARSDIRSQDINDPGVKSRQEAENLLDSLKDDEHHVTARTLNGNNTPPPPPSGKDW